LLPVDRLQFDCVPTFESSDYYLWIWKWNENVAYNWFTNWIR
jgi:hypothetical protein